MRACETLTAFGIVTLAAAVVVAGSVAIDHQDDRRAVVGIAIAVVAGLLIGVGALLSWGCAPL